MKKAAAYVALAVLLAACTSTEDAATTGAGDLSTPAQTAPSPDSSSPPDGSNGEELPVIPLLAASQAPAGMGEPLSLIADERLSGDVYLVGPDGDLASGELEAGQGSIGVPAGLTPGLYGLRLNEDEAWGTVTIVDSPGLLIRGAPYVSEGAEPHVEAFVHGIGTGMVVAVELASEGIVERMVPHPLLGLAPVPATSSVQGIGEGRHQLVLPEGFTGTVRLVADDPGTLADPYSENAPAVASNELRIQTCDEKTTIAGDLGTAGVVTVRPAGVSDVFRAGTQDGTFEIVVPAGMNLVSAVRDDGAILPPQMVRAQCGANLVVGDLTEPVDTGPQAGTYLGGLTLDDLWVYTTTASGDLEFSQEGFADCTVLDGALEVTFGASSSDPWLYHLTIDQPLNTGKYEGQLLLEDVFTREVSEGVLSGEIEVGRVEDFDAVGGAFSGTIEGSLGTIELDIRFTCAVFDLTGALPGPTLVSLGNGLAGPALPRIAALAQPSGGTSSGEECKKVFINGSQPEGVEGFVEVMMGYWAANIMPAVPRLEIITAEDIRVLLDAEAARQLLGVSDSDGGGIDIAGAVGSDFLLQLDNKPAGDTWHFSATLYDLEQMRQLASFEATGGSAEAAAVAMLDRWSEMVDPLARAGICAEFSPESAVVDVGANEDFTVRVTNLAGEPAESAEVTAITSMCGSWQPSSGAVDGTEWASKFTAGDDACEETARVSVQAEGTVGEVNAEATTAIVVEALWKFEAKVTLDDGHSLIVADSSGEFFVESDFDALIGAGTGSVTGSGEVYCEVNDALFWQPYDLTATYKVMVSGQVRERPEIGPWSVYFAPQGFDWQSRMTYKAPSDCFEAGTYTNDLLGYLGVGALVAMPHWYNNQPNGFLTDMNPSGNENSFEETLSALPGARIEVRIWKPQP